SFNDRELFLTASMGIALADGEPRRTEEVLKDAELAMYHAKRIGGDRIEVFKPSMRARQSDRVTLESDLRRAPQRQARHPPPHPARRAPEPPRRAVRRETRRRP